MSAPRVELSCDHFGPKADRLLLPLDLARCPLEIFPLANGFVRPFGGEIILLHVLEQPARTMSGDEDGERRLARRHLERLGSDGVRSSVEVSCRVRRGAPHEEILAEATAAGVDLILLPTFVPSLWKKLWGTAGAGGTARHLFAAEPPCRLFVADVRTSFNCWRRWAREEARSSWAA